MYVDRDSSGRIAVMDLKPEEFETIRRAIKAFKTGLLQNRLPPDSLPEARSTSNTTAQG